MMRNKLLCLIGVLLGLIKVGSSQEKKNVLWIYVEDLSPWISAYGYEVNAGKTPAIDALIEEGVMFSRCYVPAPVCSACRSALITGVYQTTTGTHQHRSSRTPESAIYLPKGIKTLPELFVENGYATFNAGKDDYNFVYKREDFYNVGKGKKLNLAAWRDVPEGKPWFGQIQLKGGKDRTNGLKDKVDPATMRLPAYFPNEAIFRKEWAHHYDTVRVTDEHVKSIMQYLKDDGILDDTIVFFFSDHGNNYSLRHKQFCYEGGVHVPLVIRGSGIGEGQVRDELVSGLDVSATTLALAGIELPSYLHGSDLFAGDYKGREFVVSARDRCDFTIDRIRTVRTERYRYLKNFMTDRVLLQAQYRDNKAPTKRLRELHAKGELGAIPEWAFFGKRPAEELYDMDKDPDQVNNLALDPAYADELKKHRKILNQWILDTGDKGEIPESTEGLRAVYNRWKKKCVNPEYDQFKKEIKKP